MHIGFTASLPLSIFPGFQYGNCGSLLPTSESIEAVALNDKRRSINIMCLIK